MEIRKSILLAGTGASLFTASPGAIAQTGERHVYDLPAQPLGEALRAVARITDRQLVADPEALEGQQAAPLSGQYSAEGAVRLLLRNSGLRASFSGRTIIIRGRLAPPRGGIADAAEEAQILVTGSRIRGARVAAPVITLSSQDMRRAGQNDLGEAIRSLPQNFSGGQNPGVAPGTVGLSNQNLTGGASANLRGLGGDATLTLLNGHRLSYGSAIQAVDISAIPLAAVERIEVVADGASAIYGSDAVGGVVNILLKRDYEGLTTAARFGAATDGGGKERQYSLTAGHRWNAGGLILAYDFSQANAIDARDRKYTDYMAETATLVPWRKNHSVLLSGHQDILAETTLALDASYNHRVSESTLNYGTQTRYVNRPSVETFSLAPSITTRAIKDWSVVLAGVYGQDRTDYDQLTYSGTTIAARSFGCYCNTVKSIELSAEGGIVHLPAGDVRVALGAGYRSNTFTYHAASLNRTIGKGTTDSYYAYGELQIPLVSPEQELVWANRLSFSAAVRYERYSRSSEVATPKFGIVYAPSPDLDIKGSWGKSFKVPTLAQQYQEQGALLYPAALVGGTRFPAGSTAMLFSGGNAGLRPERASSWSLGFAAHPRAVPSLDIEVSYFNVRYRGRIREPISGVNLYNALSDPTYEQYLLYDPSAAAQAALIASTGRTLSNYSGAAYDPGKVVAIMYNTYVNGTRQRISGVDSTIRYQLSLQEKGDLLLQGNGSWLRSKEQINDTAPLTALAGVIFNSPRFRGRASLTWMIDGFSLSGYANHIGKLVDTRSAVPVAIKDQTTFDLSASYASPSEFLLGAMEIAVSARNVFNKRPPYAAPSGGYDYYVNYDSTNYSPIGRFVSLSISKTW